MIKEQNTLILELAVIDKLQAINNADLLIELSEEEASYLDIQLWNTSDDQGGHDE